MFREKLGHLEGGTQTLVDALIREIESNGGQILLSEKVKTIKCFETHGIVETLSSSFKASHVICTTPLQELPLIEPPFNSELSKKYNGFIAIGCIIKGETNNFDIISNIITDAIMKLSIHLKKPIGNAILTCYNFKQAQKRIVKGAEAATAVMSVLKNV